MIACDPGREAMLVCYSAVVIILWLTIFPMFHTFLESDRKHKGSRIIFWFAILELIASLIVVPIDLAFAFAMNLHSVCHSVSFGTYTTLLSTLVAMGAFQSFVMEIVWFSRLYRTCSIIPLNEAHFTSANFRSKWVAGITLLRLLHRKLICGCTNFLWTWWSKLSRNFSEAIRSLKSIQWWLMQHK